MEKVFERGIYLSSACICLHLGMSSLSRNILFISGCTCILIQCIYDSSIIYVLISREVSQHRNIVPDIKIISRELSNV